MKYWICLHGVCAAALLVASNFAEAIDGNDPKISSAKFKITTKKKDDSVEIRAEKDKTVFSVKSPSGIGQAVIERLDERWPKVVELRLNLSGLESFRISNGNLKLDTVASIQDGKPKVRVWKDGKEDALLDAKSPLWIDVRILGRDGKPARAIPLNDGHFEVTLPKAFFQGNPKSITLNWIDFYRN